MLEDDPPIGELDLTLLSEVQRSEKGAIEVAGRPHPRPRGAAAGRGGGPRRGRGVLRGGGGAMMRFSAKQRRALTWWRPDSPDAAFEAIICDGAVRSGKTLCMGLSFFLRASAWL